MMRISTFLHRIKFDWAAQPKVIPEVKMSLVETIEQLSTSPRRLEEEYDATSDFLEWFYQHVYRQLGAPMHPILEKITHHPEYQCIQEQCLILLNISHGKNRDNETLTKEHENLKKWLLDTIRECS